MHLLKDPSPSIRAMSYPRLLGCRSLLLGLLGSQWSPSLQHMFGNVWGTTASVAGTTWMWFYSSALREAPDRKHSPTNEEYGVVTDAQSLERAEGTQSFPRHEEGDTIHLLHHTASTNLPDRSLVQKRLSMYNWNPGPRREKEAFEKRIAGRLYVITWPEAFWICRPSTRILFDPK